jgi:hypothetical protein
MGTKIIKHPGDKLYAAEITELSQAVDKNTEDVTKPSHILFAGHFVQDGSDVENGEVLPVLKINPAVLGGGGGGTAVTRESVLAAVGNWPENQLPAINLMQFLDEDYFEIGSNNKIRSKAPVDPGIPTPAAPTGGVVNDTANSFGFALVSGFANLNQYEQQIASDAVADVTANPINVGNRAVVAGGVKVRVKASGSNNASSWLVSQTAYTYIAPPVQDNLTPVLAADWDFQWGVGLTANGNTVIFPQGSPSSSFGQAWGEINAKVGDDFIIAVSAPADFANTGSIIADETGNDGTNDARVGIYWSSSGSNKGRFIVTSLAITYGHDDLGITPGAGVTPQARIRGTSTTLFTEESWDNGATWTAIPAAPVIPRGSSILWMKTFFGTTGAITNIRQSGLTPRGAWPY